MFTVDIIVKYTPTPLSIQKKSAEDAQGTYNQILDALRGGNAQVLEFTCDKITDKKLAILSSEISAVQISDKTGGNTAGRPPGFVGAKAE
ncbi:hypothetical protein PA905_24780 [Planktothrix agardhii CCAP 1459/11A]|jgi:hypothetical protein|uniref:Uncharacterized protein n=1 Tax=Planktothrix agardhii CCAP 1459/11A TaxID=282420 RepID=A0A4P5ZMH3_PLAAG|nr:MULTISPECIES: hypothetical protein [Planktothrix]GDZ94522.1 hypothetical protein PA905_24780 [Planktothrix agardhii CCAP 1459/11A]CAD5952996.1 UPF0367 protein [Planktothrix rubescens]CAH2570763.1 UPF0367 protein [Planktothrix rubescens]